MNKHRSDIGFMSRLFFRLLPVQILAQLITPVNDIISSLFASNYIGARAMSAVGLYNPIDLFITGISMLIATGAQILCARYIGKEEREGAQNMFSTGLVLTIGFSALSIAVLVLGTLTGLTRIFTADEAVRVSLNHYILGRAVGILPSLLRLLLATFMALENRRKEAILASVVYLVLNPGLTFLFVVMLGMGEFGLSLASSISMWGFLLIELKYFFSGRSMLKLSFSGARPGHAWDIMKTGFPDAISYGYLAVCGFIVNALISRYIGSAGLSANAAAVSLLDNVWAILYGMQAVALLLMSVSVGEEDRESLVNVMRVILYRCVPLIVCVSAVVIMLAGPLAQLFFRDPADPVCRMTTAAFRIIPLCLPFTVIRMQFSGYAKASGQQLLAHTLTLLDSLVFIAGFSALLIRFMGFNAVCFSYVFCSIGCILFVVLWSWVKRKSFPRSIEQVLMIPDDFGVTKDARIDITVRSIDEVVHVSQQVIDFCRRRGISERTGYFSGLFLEEMAANVVEHGFNKDRKSHSVDIRVVHKGDDVILRIKDDCIPFDPSEQMEVINQKDRVKGIGIRLVYRGAKDIRYQSVMGLNVLTIRM